MFALFCPSRQHSRVSRAVSSGSHVAHETTLPSLGSLLATHRGLAPRHLCLELGVPQNLCVAHSSESVARCVSAYSDAPSYHHHHHHLLDHQVRLRQLAALVEWVLNVIVGIQKVRGRLAALQAASSSPFLFGPEVPHPVPLLVAQPFKQGFHLFSPGGCWWWEQDCVVPVGTDCIVEVWVGLLIQLRDATDPIVSALFLVDKTTAPVKKPLAFAVSLRDLCHDVQLRTLWLVPRDLAGVFEQKSRHIEMGLGPPADHAFKLLFLPEYHCLDLLVKYSSPSCESVASGADSLALS